MRTMQIPVRRDPDDRGYFGAFGGKYVPETLVEPIEEHPHDRLVGHELAAAHEAVSLPPERAAGGDGGPEQVAGAEHGNPEMAGEDRRLGSLPGPRRAQENDHGHRGMRLPRSAASGPCGVRGRAAGRHPIIG